MELRRQIEDLVDEPEMYRLDGNEHLAYVYAHMRIGVKCLIGALVGLLWTFD